MIPELRAWVRAALARRVDEAALAWFDATAAQVAAGVSDARFASLISMASRHARRRPAELDGHECAAAAALVEGWNPERWSVLDLLRAGLVLAREDLEEESGPRAVLGAIKFGDLGELVALYRTLCLLPRPDDYVWQAGEGCRSNMNEVFEAIACDNPFPVRNFDDVAWRALAIKALFVGAPLWRVQGLDGRLGEELAHVALDLCDERRSAGRRIFPELWMCMGKGHAERARASIETELSGDDELSRKAAILALGRMGETERLREIERDGGSLFGPTAHWALMGRHDQTAFRSLSPPEGATPTTIGEPA